MLSLFDFDKQFASPIIGVDEVGRGCWAGPVVACALSITKQIPSDVAILVKDSKKLSAKLRCTIVEKTSSYVTHSIGMASSEEIDKLNILQATFLAMERALASFNTSVGSILVDGNLVKKSWKFNAIPIVKGDSKSLNIALASIFAKENRDAMLKNYAKTYNHYGFQNNMGYGTKEHSNALAQHGICNIHRKSFAPIKNLIK